MKQILISISLIISSFLAGAQDLPLQAFEAFIGTWKAVGVWGDGSKFYQVTTFAYDLNGSIVTAKAHGYTDQDQKVIGPRNHGIRQYNATSQKILFWEFDVFGGLTTGEVTFEGNDMFYTYDYGGTLVTDGWIRQDDGTFEFVVGTRENGVWTQTFLSCPLQKL